MIALALRACSATRRHLSAVDSVLRHVESVLVDRLLADEGFCAVEGYHA
jgi:hypothetical protein